MYMLTGDVGAGEAEHLHGPGWGEARRASRRRKSCLGEPGAACVIFRVGVEWCGACVSTGKRQGTDSSSSRQASHIRGPSSSPAVSWRQRSKGERARMQRHACTNLRLALHLRQAHTQGR